MTKATNKDLARAIYLAIKDKGSHERGGALGEVIKFLARRNLLSRSELILSELEKVINEAEGRLVAKVKTAKKLSASVKTDLAHRLKKRYSGNAITLNEEIDQRLLGEMRIQVGDEVIDLSLKNKINQLEEYLMKSA